MSMTAVLPASGPAGLPIETILGSAGGHLCPKGPKTPKMARPPHNSGRYVTLYIVRHGCSETPIFSVIKVHIVMDGEDSGGKTIRARGLHDH